MKKLLLIVISLMVLACSNAQARNSAASYDNKYYSQQEFVQAYNNSTGTIYRDYVVVLDTTPGVNPNNNLGQYITEVSGGTTDSIYVFGVSDETIPAGQLGRIAIRGPHKVNWQTFSGSTLPTAGGAISACKSNQALITGGLNGGVACPYSTATGTAGGALGFILNTTATTDTGDVGTSTSSPSNTTGSEYWVWLSPQILR